MSAPGDYGPLGGHPDPELTSRQRRRTLRAALYAASLALLLWAAWVVPLPYTEFVPGEPTSIPPLIEIDGAPTTEIQGDTALLTVLLQSSTTRTAVGALLDSDRRLRPTAEIVPTDVDRDEFLEQERARFRRQFDVAAAVGAQAAGVEVTISMVPLVVDVIDGGPAHGALRPGDVIRAVEGEPVERAEELQEAVRSHEVGDTVALEIGRGDEDLTVEVTLGVVEPPDGAVDPGDEDQPALGVLIESVADRLEVPFELQLAETRIGGPSAGLMIALTVYDLLADEDLIGGRLIHGTGSVDAEGRVGPVGGVPEKMRAATDADLVLVPQPLLDDALATAPDGIEVVGVATFDEALEALRQSR